ncbi:hypothetical protein EKK58_01825 [Candidatus Dependentiae bacterium]|nr:MAG: hypothetical protein EKK58_01825 [Candidatus Dependentiae bacterium]
MTIFYLLFVFSAQLMILPIKVMQNQLDWNNPINWEQVAVDLYPPIMHLTELTFCTNNRNLIDFFQKNIKTQDRILVVLSVIYYAING